MPWPPRSPTLHAAGGMVCSVDHVASGAGVAMLRAGGSAADAAIADQRGPRRHHAAHVRHGRRPVRARPPPGRPAGRALRGRSRRRRAATPSPCARRGTGRCPSAATSAAHPCPGASTAGARSTSATAACRSPTVLEPARRCAEDGFAASPLLALATALVADVAGADDFLPPGGLAAGRARPSAGGRGRPSRAIATRRPRRVLRGRLRRCPHRARRRSVRATPTWRGPRPTGSRRSSSRRGATASGPSRRRRRATWR